MSAIPYVAAGVLPDTVPTYSLDTVAKGLRVSPSKVLQYIRDGRLIAVRRGGDLHVPQAFFGEVDGRFAVAKHLAGLLSVLADGGFTIDEAMRWLFEEQEDLEGGAAPIDVLHTDHAREVIRRAQSLAF
ncbi:Rv2175c family DNA-binding protein [Tsukamurella sp. 8F]|uniref:Rv2175c family DNA-binding protein n=1 Tax=unclassified Tsukamurella TaxID=2633480 RepID=UPI0023B9B85B|nr:MULTISPECIES: Rv2175c family DNA-binding protein [unclassified Tsukamurella]MDF0532023.1 Rv2175c family DNA-binding protein [Tsukamurella sp. 8J]MDF0588428.1 Rv2175c family DNA-binding protein [Tsukamurella sp. 8F]